jgi:hypothetical protein
VAGRRGRGSKRKSARKSKRSGKPVRSSKRLPLQSLFELLARSSGRAGVAGVIGALAPMSAAFGSGPSCEDMGFTGCPQGDSVPPGNPDD